MTERNELNVGGYYFGSPADAEKARLERSQIEFFEPRLEGKSARNILAVYNRILDEKVFVTPVGWEYAQKLQNRLRGMGVEEEELRPVPLYITFVHDNEEKKTPRPRIVPSRKKEGQGKFRISVLINIILAAMVAAMLMIAVNSKNPNILNYKNRITNEYAAWEQELTEREQAVKQKEAELRMPDAQ